MYIAIPDKGYKDTRIVVYYGNRAKIIDNWCQAEAFRKFPDQFGQGFYMLGYFKWSDETTEPQTNAPEQLQICY